MAHYTGLYAKGAEPIGDWLDRWFVPRPRYEDGELVQFGDDGLFEIRLRRCYLPLQKHVLETTLVYEDGEQIVLDEDGRVKRPAPEVLGADGLPLNEDDTVYGTGREQHRYTVQVPYSINEAVGQRFCVQCYDHDEGNITWCDPSMLTHTPPDTLERLRDDIAEWRADCANPGGGWDAKTAEWVARIDAIIRRTGGAE